MLWLTKAIQESACAACLLSTLSSAGQQQRQVWECHEWELPAWLKGAQQGHMGPVQVRGHVSGHCPEAVRPGAHGGAVGAAP